MMLSGCLGSASFPSGPWQLNPVWQQGWLGPADPFNLVLKPDRRYEHEIRVTWRCTLNQGRQMGT